MSAASWMDHLDLARPGLEAVAALRDDPDAAALRLLAYFRSRSMRYHVDPAAPLRDLDHIARDPLDRTEPDDVVRHVFSLAGTPPVDQGAHIDWRRETGYLQWHCQLCRQPFWLTLIEAWRRTGDETYIREWARQLESWDEQVPPHYPADGVVRSIDVGLRLVHWMRLFPVAVQSPVFDGPVLRRFLKHIHGACEYLNARGAEGYCPGNHGVFEAMGVLQAAFYMPEFKAASRWREDAARCIAGRILTDVRSDGGHLEQSTHYHAAMLESYLTFCKLADLAGLDVVPEARRRVGRMAEFVAALRMPDGRLAPVGDSGDESAERILRIGAEALKSPGLLAPSPDRVFEESGVAILKGPPGDRDSRWLLFDTGPHGGWHGHYDLLQVAAGGGGRSWLADRGCGRYDAQWRPLMRSTLMHSTVNVDFHDYLDEGALETEAPSRARLLRADIGGPIKVLHGSHDAYSSPGERIVVERQVIMIRNDYWIVADRVRSQRLHEFASAWHFEPGSLIDLAGSGGVCTAFPTANLAVIPLFGKARFSTIPRWHVPRYPDDPPAPVWVAEGVGRDWLFAVALVPCPGACVPLRDLSTLEVAEGFEARLGWEEGTADRVRVTFGPRPGGVGGTSLMA